MQGSFHKRAINYRAFLQKMSRATHWMNHGMLHVSCQSCHILMSHVTYIQTMSRVNQSCHIRTSHVTHIMSHVWMSHGTHWMNHAMSHAIMAQTWMSHVTHMNEACHVTHVVSHTQMSHGFVWEWWYVCIAIILREYVLNKLNKRQHTQMRHISNWMSHVQGGEDPKDALSCRSFSAKEPLIIGLFSGKWPIKIRASYDSTPPCNIIHTLQHI